ncbi:methionine-rich copper-binding protein CopC [Propionicimonas paludicola]|uniref:Methionine-rich copper-binding protein CopC n=1 Tax=Propionicimonas paludicola TaxID=185243 RepID=A0A2A9CUM1_9ACTN|nr:copper resistance protein CopC [Propionicimonas paludicola]PFG17836.1 methionine-rich copper-binding protein CopC [Propionicimonas paludicola]
MNSRSRFGVWGGLIALVASLLVALGGAPAHAQEAVLEASDPYPHQQLDAPPSGVVLAFVREVDAAAAQIVVTNSRGNSVNINSLIVEGTNVSAQVKPNLPKGTYTVHYQVNRKDGQVEGGAFQFSYGPGTWTTLPDERWSGNAAQPTVLVSPSVDTSTELPTPVATDSPSGSPTPSMATPATASSAPAPQPLLGSSAALWAGVAAIGVVLLVALGVVISVIRRRSKSKR